MQTFLSILFPFLATACFYLAVLFIGGDLWKSQLGWLYTQVPNWWLRMLIVIIPFSGTGEILLRYAFNKPNIATPSIIVAGIIIPAIVGLWFKQKMPNLEVIVLITCICLLAIYLNRSLSSL